MSSAFLFVWGWRISFWIGALIGVGILYIRNRLHETPEYIKYIKCKLNRTHLSEMINKNKEKVLAGISYGFINAASYYLIATYIPLGLVQVMSIDDKYNSFTSLCVLILTTLTLPLFGVIAEKLNTKKLLLFSAISMLLLLYPLYQSIQTNNAAFFLIIVTVYVMLNSCLTALLGYYVAKLFTGPMRYTGVGLAFNLSDGVIGGFTPAISLVLFHYTNNPASFCWFLLACAVVSIISFLRIEDERGK